MDKDKIIELLSSERERQKSLPGSEYDITNSPNDWITIVTRYLSENCRRKGITPSEEEFTDSFVKAGAIIIAALEHIDFMTEQKKLRK